MLRYYLSTTLVLSVFSRKALNILLEVPVHSPRCVLLKYSDVSFYMGLFNGYCFRLGTGMITVSFSQVDECFGYIQQL